MHKNGSNAYSSAELSDPFTSFGKLGRGEHRNVLSSMACKALCWQGPFRELPWNVEGSQVWQSLGP